MSSGLHIYNNHHENEVDVDDFHFDEPEASRNDDKDDNEDEGLPEDVYSLLTVSRPFSPGFFYSLFVIGIQYLLMLLVLLDLLDTDYSFQILDKHNPTGVPKGVPAAVTVAQGVSMFLSVSTETNFLMALNKLTGSHDIPALLRANPDIDTSLGSWTVKYWIAILLQLCIGIGMLTLGFILNMAATTVLDLMLNVAGLAIISELQDLFFGLAKEGYLSSWVQEETALVTNFEIPKEMRQFQKHNPAARHWKQFIFVASFLGLLASYSVVVKRQRSGEFLCQSFFVQFGDAFRPELPSFSGEYRQTGKRVGGRVVYEDDTAKKSGARFWYCEAEQSWTFSGGKFYLEFGNGPGSEIYSLNDDDDPCETYWAKSQPTETYAITETTSEPWMILDYYTNRTLPIDFMTLFCLDCVVGGRTCSNHGVCRNSRCECDFGRFGLDCEYALPCTSLELDRRTEPFPAVLRDDQGRRSIPSTSFNLLRDDEGIPVVVYNKPVYVTTEKGNTSTKEEKIKDVMLFLGRRWGLTLGSLEFLDGQPTRGSSRNADPTSRQSLITYLRSEQLQYIYIGYDFHFLSDAMDIHTPSDKVIPIEVSWFKARRWLTLAATESEDSNGPLDLTVDLYRADQTQPIPTVLLCARCQSAVNPCLNRGKCRNQDDTPFANDGNLDGGGGECECLVGFGGHLCEKELACTDEGGFCFFNGTCNESTGDCVCPPTHEGRLCQYETASAQRSRKQ
jgi:hypothetical protein